MELGYNTNTNTNYKEALLDGRELILMKLRKWDSDKLIIVLLTPSFVLTLRAPNIPTSSLVRFLV